MTSPLRMPIVLAAQWLALCLPPDFATAGVLNMRSIQNSRINEQAFPLTGVCCDRLAGIRTTENCQEVQRRRPATEHTQNLDALDHERDEFVMDSAFSTAFRVLCL
jgi:hypothetical protein